MEENKNNHIIDIYKVIQVGNGPFDKIGIHRVTKDLYECSQATVVMVPGSNSDFNTSFFKMAVFLANQGVDVWGIDFRYSFVPDDINSNPYCLAKDCSFFKDQDTNLHISDLDILVKIAEMTAKGGKVFLLGFSQGAYFAYRYASQYPDIKGIIPMDIAYNIDPTLTDVIGSAMSDVIERQAKIANGIYYEDVLTEKFIASEALQNPDGPSVVIPGLTNKQAFLFALTATYQLPGFNVPGFRYNHGTIADLVYTDYNTMITQTGKLNSFQSILPITELERQYIEPTPSIPNITVPILHVAAEVGFGTFGFYTPDRISEFNNDVTKCLISDYGHADLVYSNTADVDVWNKICKWIKQHSQH